MLQRDQTLPTPPNPAQSYGEALARLEAVRARDTAEYNPLCHTTLLTHGQRVANSLVFIHGMTNCPQQFKRLGERCHAQGYNVLLPRVPYHGHQDRLSTHHGRLTAAELVAYLNESLDIAEGLGERVTVAGLSLGGVLAAWAAQNRPGLDRAVLISPAFAPRGWHPAIVKPLAALVRRLPNVFVWWDSKLKEAIPGPPYGYPRFASRAAAQMMHLGAAVRAQAKQARPQARSIVLITNANDPAIDNPITYQLLAAWQHQGANIHHYEFPSTQGLGHDLIDPQQPDQQVEFVYPILLDLIAGRRETAP
jgi:alpha-beta hydrolase superfamily lysophospholipase